MDWQDRADEFESEMKDQMADENTTEIDENLSDDEVVEETEKVPQNANLAVPDVPKEVSAFTDIATARMQEDFVSGKRDVNETGKEIVHALTLEKSVEETRENRDFLADIKKTKQDELKLNFENKVLEEERKKLEAKQNKAEAFYKSFRPILEFDFSNLRKVQKKRVIKDGEKADDMRRFRRKDGTEYVYEREQPKTYADRSYGKKLDKTGGTITGSLSVNGGVTVGGNLTVNGTTTTIDSTTLQVKDKLIEVAHGNTTKLTSPAGLVVPKYDGTNSGALVFDGDGMAQVGKVVLDAAGNIDTTKSGLQTLATRTNLVGGNLVQYDSTNKTLVDSGKKVGDFALKTDIPTVPTNYVTTDTKQDITGEKAFKNTNGLSTNRIHNLSGNAVYDFDGTNVRLGSVSTPTHIRGSEAHPKYEMPSGTAGETVKKDIALVEDIKTTKVDNAAHADTAGKVSNELEIIGTNSGGTANALHYTGDKYQRLTFSKDDFTIVGAGDLSAHLRATGVTAGSYSAVTVDTKGRVTTGGKSVEFGTSGQTAPSDSLMVDGFFLELQ